MTLFSVVEMYQRFEATHYLHLQDWRLGQARSNCHLLVAWLTHRHWIRRKCVPLDTKVNVYQTTRNHNAEYNAVHRQLSESLTPHFWVSTGMFLHSCVSKLCNRPENAAQLCWLLLSLHILTGGVEVYLHSCWPRYQVAVTGQLHTTVALPPLKQSTVPMK
jgi:hypothetical protein